MFVGFALLKKLIVNHLVMCNSNLIVILFIPAAILTNAITSNTEDDAIDVEMQSDMLLILSCLCDGDMHRKELFGEAGVNVCVNYLKTDPKLLNSGLGHHRLLLSAVDCVW